ncbi:MAG: DUF4340 domain-containing protein [Verrucomicrobiota bacterium]
MNKRQVIILWAIALLLGAAVAAVKLSQNKDNRGATQRVQGETLFESFPATDVVEISIQGAAEAVTLAKKDGKWVVKERSDFPANTTFVNNLLRTLVELKVTLGVEAGPSFAPRFGMDVNSKMPAERGLTALFKDASGKEIASVTLGKNIESESAAASMMGGGAIGRYIRNHADASGFYAISEMFPSVSADPKRWLADGFVNPEKVKSITVTAPGKADLAWTLTRDGEDAEFKLEGAKSDEVLDTTATSALKAILSYARFEDVIAPDKVTALAQEGQDRTATIETFEGFTYTVKLTPTKPPAAPAADADADPDQPAPAQDNFLMTVDVAAELPKERKKEADEKPEDAKTKDAAFSERLKSLTEKLATEKALAGITFEVSKATIEALLKDRASIIAKAKPAAAGAGVQSFPGGMIAPPPGSINAAPNQAETAPTSPMTPPISATTPPVEAVTPPIQIPAQEDEELEDEDSGDEEMDEDE